VRTASRRDRHRLPVASSLDEIPARGGHAGKLRPSGRDIDLLELSAPNVVEDARPRILGLTHDDCVGVAPGLFRERRRMRPTNHDRYAAAAEFPRKGEA
jgi:hypothetical protein